MRLKSEVTEVAGADNVVDGVETPVTSRVKDARVRLNPDPKLRFQRHAISATNLPDIPGSLDLLIQSEVWTDPTNRSSYTSYSVSEHASSCP